MITSAPSLSQTSAASVTNAATCAKDPALMARRIRSQVRNPEVFVRGYVRHPDHATIVLPGWHRVHLNAEFTTGTVTFYD